VTDNVRPGCRFIGGCQHIPPSHRPTADSVREVKAQHVADDLDLDHSPIFSPFTGT
jgi:hypothetical protein